MTQFHQEHQQVSGQQQNAGGDIHNRNQSLTFGSVPSIQSVADLKAFFTVTLPLASYGVLVGPFTQRKLVHEEY